jgi:formate dehydrogenase major subunit
VAGLATSFGSGAMTNSIAEIGDAACILAIGTNTTAAHPVIALQVKKAARREAPVIVVNPKRIDLCRWATIFLQLRPGTDVALVMGMMRVIADEGLLDKAFIEQRCENFEEFLQSLKGFDLDSVERITGVPRAKIAQAARVYATNKPGSIIYCLGITEHSHGTDNVMALANLALLTGNVGQRFSGVNPLRGQNNVQGACDMGCLPNVLPGYQKVTDAAVREKFSRAWGRDLPDKPGMTMCEFIPAVLQGKVRAMYIVGMDNARTMADIGQVEKALQALDFLVVQDIFITDTARFADVVLPAASFAEKDGTFINSERRVQRIRKAIEPIGDSWPDWKITSEIAKRTGATGFDYAHPSEIWDEIASLCPNFAGISYERIEEVGLQWPCPSPDHPGTPTLHTQKFATPSGKGKFAPLAYRPPAEMPDDDYPLVLTTDRSLFHFHTRSMTGKVKGLDALHNEELVNINPDDAAALGIEHGDLVRVSSRRGQVTARAKVTDAVPPGTISMSFHFTECPTNVLTSPANDPVTKTPEFKVAAVRVRRAE